MSGTERGRRTPYLGAVGSGDRGDWGYLVTGDGRVVRVRRVGDRLIGEDGTVVAEAQAAADSERAA
jgi:hypothetical protein